MAKNEITCPACATLSDSCICVECYEEQKGQGDFDSAPCRLRVVNVTRASARTAPTAAPAVSLTEEAGRLVLVAPYSAKAVEAFRTVTGRKWNSALKVNTFPISARNEVSAIVKALYRAAV